MRFQVGDVVQYDNNPFEMISWRDETGALVAGPPGCPVTVESINENQYTFTVVWFYEGCAELQREEFPMEYFIKV